MNYVYGKLRDYAFFVIFFKKDLRKEVSGDDQIYEIHKWIQPRQNVRLQREQEKEIRLLCLLYFGMRQPLVAICQLTIFCKV